MLHSHAAGNARWARRAGRRTLAYRLIRNATLGTGFILGALAVGAIGYHALDGLPWLDAVLNASMILTSMGPIAPISNPTAKIFAATYALFSGVFFISVVTLLLAPALKHVLHRFHLGVRQRDSERIDRQD